MRQSIVLDAPESPMIETNVSITEPAVSEPASWGYCPSCRSEHPGPNGFCDDNDDACRNFWRAGTESR
jgi:hypothetical protein